jgi:hypothetical protein
MTSPLRRKHRTTASARPTAETTEARPRECLGGALGGVPQSGTRRFAKTALPAAAIVSLALCCHSAWAGNIDSGLRSSLRWLSPKSAATRHSVSRSSPQRSADRWSRASEPTGVLDAQPIAAPHTASTARKRNSGQTMPATARQQTKHDAGWQPPSPRVPLSSDRNGRGEIRLTAGTAARDPFAPSGAGADDRVAQSDGFERNGVDDVSGQHFTADPADDTDLLPPEVVPGDELVANDDGANYVSGDAQSAGDVPAEADVVGPHLSVAGDGADEPQPFETDASGDMPEGLDGVPLLARQPRRRSAFDDSGDPPPAEDARDDLPEIGGGFRNKESAPERCPSPKDLKPISQITHRIAAEPGLFPQECALSEEPFQPRNFQITTYTWKASALCHKPLYFQQPKLERYGHTFGPVLTPALTAGHFFISVIALPYKMGMNPPWECVYPLGWYRPGSCAPYTLGPVPISLRGAATQGVVTTGLWFLFP